jgi:dephospho-CoA kinase
MRRVAITGGIATGKSYALERFRALGVPTIDADQLAREVVAPGGPVLGRIAERFGAGVLTADGALDRSALAAVVFADPAARRDLEAILHPEIYARIRAWFAALEPGVPYAMADIPLLYETGREQDFDRVVVTACEPEEQLRRLRTRDGLSESAARQRLAAQASIAAKRQRADFVISTDGSKADTDRQVAGIHGALLAEASRRS